MLDVIFWSVVCIWLWFAYDTWRWDRVQKREQDKRATEMETLTNVEH